MADTVINTEEEKSPVVPSLTMPSQGVTVGTARQESKLDEDTLNRLGSGQATKEDLLRLKYVDSFMGLDKEEKRAALNRMSLQFFQLRDKPTEQDKIINQIYGEITPQTWFERQQAKARPILHTALPIAGDIAGTVAAGYATGGIAPAVSTLGRLGIGGLKLGARALGAGAGSGLGKAGAQILGGQDINLSDVGKEAALGTALESGFGLAGAGIRGTGQLLRQTSLMGTFFEKQARDTAIKEAIQETEKAFKNYGLPRVGSKATAGIAVGEEFTKRLDFETTFTDYNKLLSSDWVGDTIQMRKTAEVLKEIIADKKARTKGKINDKGALTKALGLKSTDYRDILEELSVSNFNAIDKGDAKFLLDQIWKEGKPSSSFGKLIPRQETAKRKLKEAMLYDFDNAAPGVWDLKEAADKYYSEAVSFLNTNRLAKQWMKPTKAGAALYEMRPEQFVDELFNTNSVDELRNFKNVIQKTPEGKEAWEALKYHWVDDIYKRNMPVDKMSGETMLYPARLANELMAKQDMIARLMPEILPKVEKEIDKYIKMTPMFIKRNIEREGFWGVQRITAPAMTGMFSRYAIPIAEGVGAISSLAVTKPKLGKILKATEAGAKYTTKAAARIPQAFKEYEDNQTQ